MNPQVLGSIVQAVGTVSAAIIVGVVGSRLSARHQQARDRQDRESQWRQHAIELTKLDLERKLEAYRKDPTKKLRPGILDFLANYRDLEELGHKKPGELYEKILKERIERSDAPQ